MESVTQSLFEAVASRDYEALAKNYAKNGRNAVVSFLSMRSRWSHPLAEEHRAEEKLDEYLQQFSYDTAGNKCGQRPLKNDDSAYCALLRELAVFLAEKSEERGNQQQAPKRKKVDFSAEAERLLRDASTALSDSRPPANFVVYQDGGTLTQERSEHVGPPVFDGSVANATPPPLGGGSVGASGGASTVLHLACALDIPLALAFLLAMGADARSSHTAFRRLMIHEAACNGSVDCLSLLLELGEKYGESASAGAEKLKGGCSALDLPFLPRRLDRKELVAPLNMYSRQSGPFSREPAFQQDVPRTDFVSLLQIFRELVAQVDQGRLSELEAARKFLEHATLSESSKTSIARSCGYAASLTDGLAPRALVRSHGGSLDGHGNTPLHWAAFKNETDCVSLLLKFTSDPNARAHPSGWTPLHDAAYSNSKECIELLVHAGAHVDARANSGATPLCFAAQEDAADAAELLLKCGADMTTRCAGGPIRDDGTVQTGGPHSRFSGYTPLHYCAHYNAHEAARVLLRHPTARAAMEIPDLSERLPIHVAVARGSSDVLRELLHAGVHVETRMVKSSREAAARSRQANAEARQADFTGLGAPATPTRRRPPSPESPSTPRRRSRSTSSSSSTPVSSPLLRSMIPSQPVTSSKPWNCLTQRSIDECRELISQSEKHWSPKRHALFTPADRRAVMELLLIGKRMEQRDGVFLDFWPLVLSFCGRGWFEVEGAENIQSIISDFEQDQDDDYEDEEMPDAPSSPLGDADGLSLPTLE